MKIISIIADALGNPAPYYPCYLKSYSGPEDALGYKSLATTRLLAEAMTFPSLLEALEFWKQQSETVPLRPDGLPNRPLTQYTIGFDEWKAE